MKWTCGSQSCFLPSIVVCIVSILKSFMVSFYQNRRWTSSPMMVAFSRHVSIREKLNRQSRQASLSDPSNVSRLQWRQEVFMASSTYQLRRSLFVWANPVWSSKFGLFKSETTEVTPSEDSVTPRHSCGSCRKSLDVRLFYAIHWSATRVGLIIS
jgi:hypothetical protein